MNIEHMKCFDFRIIHIYSRRNLINQSCQKWVHFFFFEWFDGFIDTYISSMPYWRVCRDNSDLSFEICKKLLSCCHVASYNTLLRFSNFLNCWLTETVSLVLLCKQGSEIAEKVKTCSHAPKMSANNSRNRITLGLKNKSRTPFTSAPCFSKYIVSRASTSGLKREIILYVAAPCESHLVVAHLRILRSVKPPDSCAFSNTENLTDQDLNIFHRFSSSWFTSCKPLNSFTKCTITSTSRWFRRLIYFIWGDKWRSRRCSPVISLTTHAVCSIQTTESHIT